VKACCKTKSNSDFPLPKVFLPGTAKEKKEVIKSREKNEKQTPNAILLRSAFFKRDFLKKARKCV
jgi:hypothetical protein